MMVYFARLIFKMPNSLQNRCRSRERSRCGLTNGKIWTENRCPSKDEAANNLTIHTRLKKRSGCDLMDTNFLSFPNS